MARRLQIKLPKTPESQTPTPDPDDDKKPAKRDVKRGSLYLPPAVHEAIRQLAFGQRRSQHQLLRDWIDAGLRRDCGKSWEEIVEGK